MSEGLGEWDDELEDTTAPGPAGDGVGAPELFYPNVAEFVRDKLAVTYRRQLNTQGSTTWCRSGGSTPKPSAAPKPSGAPGSSCVWTAAPA
ncbi:hypothetical protein GCM10027090_39620 [Sinomonas soli]